MNVLLVDDQEIDRELIKHSLFASGGQFDITETSDPNDGMSWIEKEKFDVILNEGVLYASKRIDITEGILKLLESAQAQTPSSSQTN